MLLCIKGMSAERVGAMLNVWDTPLAMWKDFKKREEEWKKENEADERETSVEKGKGKTKVKKRGIELFFADAVQGEGRQKIGDALSREVSKKAKKIRYPVVIQR